MSSETVCSTSALYTIANPTNLACKALALSAEGFKMRYHVQIRAVKDLPERSDDQTTTILLSATQVRQRALESQRSPNNRCTDVRQRLTIVCLSLSRVLVC